MKKVLLLIAVVLLGSSTIAQEKTYLVFEFMRVDNNQENAYQETESFWEKIHKQRVKNGDIIGWDLCTTYIITNTFNIKCIWIFIAIIIIYCYSSSICY